MSVVKPRLALLLVAAILTVACGSNDTPSTPPATPAQSIVETFTDTLNPSSAKTHTFNSNNAGDVIVQLTALDPADAVVGLSVGTSNGFACQSGVSTEKATAPSSLSGVARAAGLLCVHIYDPFTFSVTDSQGTTTTNNPLPGPVTYSLQVTHY